MQVSQMWLCCPSAFKPAVGPNVVSDAGEPASPKAAAAAKTIIIEGTLNPNFTQIGTYKTARIGIVPKEVPIPIVMNSPTNSIKQVARILLDIMYGAIVFTRKERKK